MVESPEDTVSALLRAIRPDIADVQDALSEIKERPATLDGGQASIIQYLVHLEQPLDLRDA
jgi:hypothetical protein